MTWGQELEDGKEQESLEEGWMEGIFVIVDKLDKVYIVWLIFL